MGKLESPLEPLELCAVSLERYNNEFDIQRLISHKSFTVLETFKAC